MQTEKNKPFELRHKAYEVAGPRVRVTVLAAKVQGKTFAPLGGFFKYDPSFQFGNNAVAEGNMCHHAAFAFPADGKQHEYVFPEEFAKRLVTQAAELGEAFEVAILGPVKAEITKPKVFAQPEAPTTEPTGSDADDSYDDEDDDA